jgi:uncharacterized membrane protein
MRVDSEENQEEENSGLPKRVFLLLAAGMVLVFVGALVIFAAAATGGGGESTSGGIVIFIGPIPIVLGAGPDASVLVLAGAILAAACVVLFVFWRRKVSAKTGRFRV